MQIELPTNQRAKPVDLKGLADEDRRFFLNRHAIRRQAAKLAARSNGSLTAEEVIKRFTIDQILSGNFDERPSV